jgi:hypothetical protein
MKKGYLALVGVLASFVLFGLSTARYPGGYDWAHHFVSTLFHPTALNGAENAARPIAVLAMFMFCVSMGILFKGISSKGKSRFHKKTIEIGGIGSMVYAFLVVTPMHDLLVTIGFLFFVAAMLATLHLLYVERHPRMLYAGIICLLLLLISAVMYYGHVAFGLLPIAQKATYAMCIGWFFAVRFSKSIGCDPDVA